MKDGMAIILRQEVGKLTLMLPMEIRRAEAGTRDQEKGGPPSGKARISTSGEVAQAISRPFVDARQDSDDD